MSLTTIGCKISLEMAKRIVADRNLKGLTKSEYLREALAHMLSHETDMKKAGTNESCYTDQYISKPVYRINISSMYINYTNAFHVSNIISIVSQLCFSGKTKGQQEISA